MWLSLFIMSSIDLVASSVSCIAFKVSSPLIQVPLSLLHLVTGLKEFFRWKWKFCVSSLSRISISLLQFLMRPASSSFLVDLHLVYLTLVFQLKTKFVSFQLYIKAIVFAVATNFILSFTFIFGLAIER